MRTVYLTILKIIIFFLCHRCYIHDLFTENVDINGWSILVILVGVDMVNLSYLTRTIDEISTFEMSTGL